MNTLLPETTAPSNRHPADHRPSGLRPQTLTYAARRLAKRYNVSPGMARVVAELVSTSFNEVRR